LKLKEIYRFLTPKWQNLFMEYKVDFKPRYGHGKPPHSGLYAIIDREREVYESFLQKALKYIPEIHKIKKLADEKETLLPAWNNEYLPGLDIVMLYVMLSEFKPKLYVEVGSGNSTKVAWKAKQDQNLQTRIISIDPFPRAEIDEISDKIIRQPFELVDLEIMAELKENDVLFIDNSHRILPNSDSTVFFLEVLPLLKKGVIVHIHDIYLPYDYPQVMCDRFYSEQYGMAICLLSNPRKYKPILPNYFISEDSQLSKTIAPVWEHPNLEGVEKHGGSFWFVINE
jgi:hypothetical protein